MSTSDPQGTPESPGGSPKQLQRLSGAPETSSEPPVTAWVVEEVDLQDPPPTTPTTHEEGGSGKDISNVHPETPVEGDSGPVGDSRLDNGMVGDSKLENVKEGDSRLINGKEGDSLLDNGTVGDSSQDNSMEGDSRLNNGMVGDSRLANGKVGDSILDNGTVNDSSLDNGTAGKSRLDNGTLENSKLCTETTNEALNGTKTVVQSESWPGHREEKEKEEKEEEEKEEKEEEEKKEEKKEENEEGVDPFSPRSTTVKPRLHANKISKSVNFKDEAEKEHPTQNGGSSHSTPTSPSSSKERDQKEGEDEEDGTAERRPNKQWSLGESNPVYRLSMKLSPNLFNMMDIPGASQHREAEKAGYLGKLSGRSFPYIPQWKRRYCVLAKGRLYYYEREDSRQGEKANGVINLEYFDQVTEAAPKDCKKATNVFIITSQDRSFFDPGRHHFSADTLPDMKDWIRRLQGSLEQIRNNNRPASATTTSPCTPLGKENGKRRKEESAAESKEDRENKENQLHSSNKDRKKKKEDPHRSRKLARTGVSSETQTTEMTDSPSLTLEQEPGTQTGTSPKGGVQLSGFSLHKAKLEVKLSKPPPQDVMKPHDRGEDIPLAGPRLSCITKERVKGPQGRRAPQNHRRTTMVALKKRASSLSALEYQDTNDNRSETSQGRTGSHRDLMEAAEESEFDESTPERQITFNDIDTELFFKPLGIDGRRREDEEQGVGNETRTNNNSTGKENKRSSKLRVNFEEGDQRRSTSRSKNGTLFNSKFSRFRETMMSFKRNRYESKEPLGPDHPDEVIHSRWSCSLL